MREWPRERTSRPRSQGANGNRKPASTRSRILDIGERLVQVRGFNGFSYADVAAEMSVTKASLHYHFPSKADLGEAIVARYAERFADALVSIDADARCCARQARGVRRPLRRGAAR